MSILESFEELLNKTKNAEIFWYQMDDGRYSTIDGSYMIVDVDFESAPNYHYMVWDNVKDKKKQLEEKSEYPVMRYFEHITYPVERPSKLGSIVYSIKQIIKKQKPEILMQTSILSDSKKIDNGWLVSTISYSWFSIYKEIIKNPNFIFEFVKYPFKFEEFIAGAYERAGYDVLLTNRSNDGGKDLIVSKSGYGAIKFIEQIKAYKPGHLVTHNDIRAMLGVLSSEPNVSKCLVTTTSDFQPNVLKSEQFKKFIPNRLELKNGEQTIDWLKKIDPKFEFKY